MNPSSTFRIAVLPGDGIGPEVMQPCVELLETAAALVGGFDLSLEWHVAGAAAFRDTGQALSASTLAACATADAILFGAMGLPHIRYADGTEIAPQLDLRNEFGLFAGVRPIRSIPGVASPLRSVDTRPIDFVIVRESTEGLFASRDKGVIEDNREARDTMVITRDVSEKLFTFSFELAKQRAKVGGIGRVTCADKANVFKSFAFFRQVFDEQAARFPDIKADHVYIDACSMLMVMRPWQFDVLVTENMFGDIISDLGAALIGGMGYAPSGDFGVAHGMFQPSHGSAPDIAGQDKANPTAMFLSAAMMLDWLGKRHAQPTAIAAGKLIVQAVDEAFASGALVTCELGGNAGTKAVADAVLAALRVSATVGDTT